MIKLIRANFFKMYCSWSFWLTLFILPLFNIYVIIEGDKEYLGLVPESGLERWNIGQCGETCFSHLMLLTYVIVAMVGMLVGDEYASGAIRNKLVSGYSRVQLYVSYLITSVCEVLIVNIFCIAVPFVVCCVRYGFDTGDTGTFLKMILYSIPPIAALVAFTLFCMILAGDRTAGMVIAFLTDLIVYYFFDWFFVRQLIYEPDKLTEAQKKLYITIDAILPSSCVEWLYQYGPKAYFFNIEHAPKSWWCFITMGVMVAAGVTMFRKTDLK